MSSCIRLFLARSTRFMPHLVLILMMASVAMPAVLVSGNASSVSAQESSALPANDDPDLSSLSGEEASAPHTPVEPVDDPAPATSALPEDPVANPVFAPSVSPGGPVDDADSAPAMSSDEPESAAARIPASALPLDDLEDDEPLSEIDGAGDSESSDDTPTLPLPSDLAAEPPAHPETEAASDEEPRLDVPRTHGAIQIALTDQFGTRLAGIEFQITDMTLGGGERFNLTTNEVGAIRFSTAPFYVPVEIHQVTLLPRCFTSEDQTVTVTPAEPVVLATFVNECDGVASGPDVPLVEDTEVPGLIVLTLTDQFGVLLAGVDFEFTAPFVETLPATIATTSAPEINGSKP